MKIESYESENITHPATIKYIQIRKREIK